MSLALSEYHVGIICALETELAAVRAMLDAEHGLLDEKDVQDHNVYFTGRFHRHNVVIACLPAGVDGVAAAAVVAKDMVRTFHHLRLGLLVGIGGGIPDIAKGIDIRLGDVVVSQPQGREGGVVQYDKGKIWAREWVRKGTMNAPPTLLLTALQSLKADHLMRDSKISSYLDQMALTHPKMTTNGYVYPGANKDLFFTESSLSGEQYTETRTVPVSRELRLSSEPQIWYGTIASGNTVVKTASVRDQIRDDCGALCVEMEAAGLMNDFPCIVIRGICDYADEFKNDDWQRYCAATAAAFAKELLLHISADRVSSEEPIRQALDTLNKQSENIGEYLRQRVDQNERHQAHAEEQTAYTMRKEILMKRQKCHQAFHTCIYSDHKDINKEAVPGTCQWLIKHPKFRRWHETAGNTLLWVSADPGCGKSVLSRFLVDIYLRQHNQPATTIHNTHSVCYFFFKDNKTQDTLSVALSALIHQLFTQQPDLVQYAVPAFERSGKSLLGDSNGLWQILLNAARDPNARSITCVLDGLDECCEPDRQRLIDFLCRFYNTTVHISESPQQHATLKFLVTSRPYSDIQDDFRRIPPSLPSIRLRGEKENDLIHEEINLVIKDHMLGLKDELQLSEFNVERIQKQLFSMENRTYLWLYLVIDNIKSTFRRSLRPDVEAIDLLPRSVDEAYEQLLSRVTTGRDKQNMRIILSIIVGARRALSIQEMALALDIATSPVTFSVMSQFTIDPDRLEYNICQWCGLFVFINHDKVFLLHQTAKEFLLRYQADSYIDSGSWKRSLGELEVEQIMANICVVFLSLNEFGDTNRCSCSYDGSVYCDTGNCWWTDRPSHVLQAQAKRMRITQSHLHSVKAFCTYATKHFAGHYRRAGDLIDSVVEERALQLHVPNNRFTFLLNTLPMGWTGSMSAYDTTRVAAFNGHVKILQRLLDRDPAIIDESHEYFAADFAPSALWIAAHQGHAEVVRLLLDRGAKANPVYFAHTPLSIASQQGHDLVIQILLGDESLALSPQLDRAFEQALFNGHVTTAEILLDKGVEINARIGTMRVTPLHTAVLEGHMDIVQMLLAKGADVNINRHDGLAPLHSAVSSGDEAMAAILIRAGANLKAYSTERGSVLRAACIAGDDTLFDMLWDKSVTSHGNTRVFVDTEAFHTAVVYCSLQVIQRFLECGVDINARGKQGQTALQAACARGDEPVMQLLLSNGASIYGKSELYGTALHAACEKGHVRIVEILLNLGADASEEFGRHGTPLQVASRYGHIEIVEVLLSDDDTCVDDYCGEYGTALQTASVYGQNKIVEILLEIGADVNAESGFYTTALHAAVAHSHTDIAQILLSAGARVEMSYGLEWSVLDMALQKSEADLLELLLDWDTSLSTERCQELLRTAYDEGNQLLIDKLIYRVPDGTVDEYGDEYDEIQELIDEDDVFMMDESGQDSHDYGQNDWYDFDSHELGYQDEDYGFG